MVIASSTPSIRKRSFFGAAILGRNTGGRLKVSWRGL
jgi:hypothetical protein